MRTLFDTDEEEEIEGKPSEITLSTASLLGIFFGLVLICGVFFGFGYSMGRGTRAGSQAKHWKASRRKRTKQLLRQTLPQRRQRSSRKRRRRPVKKSRCQPAITRAKPADAPAPEAPVSDYQEMRPRQSRGPNRHQQASRWPQAAAYSPPTDAPPMRYREADGTDCGRRPPRGCRCAGLCSASAWLWSRGAQ